MKCPKCEVTNLEKLKLKKSTELITVDRCKNCSGAWFDRKELEALLTVAIQELQIPADAEQTDRCCPKKALWTVTSSRISRRGIMQEA